MRIALIVFAGIVLFFFVFYMPGCSIVSFFGMAPDMGRVEKDVKKFIGLKIPDAASTPVVQYNVGWCDSSYEFVFDADHSWKESFKERFNMIPDPEAKDYYFAGTLSLSDSISNKISEEMKGKMICFKSKYPIRYNKRDWTVVLLMDPGGTLCFLKLYEDSPMDKSLHHEINI